MAQINYSLLIVGLVGILLYSEESHGLGINCRGGPSCPLYIGYLSDVTNSACNLPSSQQFGPGQHIAKYCNEGNVGIAAFTQKTKNSISAGEACQLLQVLLNDHKCTACGSIPLGYPGTNNVNQGELTVNNVKNC